MPSSRDASSSDLERAREISRRLMGAPPARPGAEPAPRPPPSASPRFSADLVRGSAPSSAAAPPAGRGGTPARGTATPSRPNLVAVQAAPVRLPPLPATGGYEALCGWCQQVLSAEAVFILDDRGLLVASVGNVPAPTAEAMGARLVFTLEQADAMKGDGERSRSIGIEFAGNFLTGWRFPMEGVILTVAVMSPKPLPANAGAIVAKAFAGPAR